MTEKEAVYDFFKNNADIAQTLGGVNKSWSHKGYFMKLPDEHGDALTEVNASSLIRRAGFVAPKITAVAHPNQPGKVVLVTKYLPFKPLKMVTSAEYDEFSDRYDNSHTSRLMIANWYLHALDRHHGNYLFDVNTPHPIPIDYGATYHISSAHPSYTYTGPYFSKHIFYPLRSLPVDDSGAYFFNAGLRHGKIHSSQLGAILKLTPFIKRHTRELISRNHEGDVADNEIRLMDNIIANKERALADIVKSGKWYGFDDLLSELDDSFDYHIRRNP